MVPNNKNLSSAVTRIFRHHEFSEFSALYDGKENDFPVIPELCTEFVGGSIHFFPEIDSTSIKAFELGQSGVKEGTAVIAESQSGGKGRRGRPWHSPKGKNIYTSIILRPRLAPVEAPRLTLISAVALAETLSSFMEEASREKASIKWPNDILLGGRKCAGILTEMKCSGDEVDFVVIGIGVNVNMKMSHMPRHLSTLATSLSMERGEEISRASVLQSLYSNIENWYKRYLSEGFLPVRERWNALSGIKGRQVRAAAGVHGYEEGRALGINDDGALLLKKQDGSLINVTVGDINIL